MKLSIVLLWLILVSRLVSIVRGSSCFFSVLLFLISNDESLVFWSFSSIISSNGLCSSAFSLFSNVTFALQLSILSFSNVVFFISLELIWSFLFSTVSDFTKSFWLNLSWDFDSSLLLILRNSIFVYNTFNIIIDLLLVFFSII